MAKGKSPCVMLSVGPEVKHDRLCNPPLPLLLVLKLSQAAQWFKMYTHEFPLHRFTKHIFSLATIHQDVSKPLLLLFLSCTILPSYYMAHLYCESCVEHPKVNDNQAIVFQPCFHSSRGSNKLVMELVVYITLTHTGQQLATCIFQETEGYSKEWVNLVQVRF